MAGPDPVDIAIPVLASLDLKESTAFYNRLGFATVAAFDEYAIVRRGGMELHFWPCADRHIAENTSCYLRVADVDALYRELAPLDLTPGRMDRVADMPWGMREFHIWDPHGNLVKIGQIIPAG